MRRHKVLIEEQQSFGEMVEAIVQEHAPADRIAARKAAEEEARALIVSNLGVLTKEQLAQCFQCADRDFWNSEPKQGRFGLTIRGANGKSICEQIDKANEWIKSFWTVPISDSFDLIAKFLSEKPILRAGHGFPTLILYLRDPQLFNVWINAMISGISQMKSGPIAATFNKDYEKYNDAVNKFRDEFKIEPQMLDIVLTRITHNNSAATNTHDVDPSALADVGGATPPNNYPFTTESFELLHKLHTEPTAATYQKFKDGFRNSVENPVQALLRSVVGRLSAKVTACLETEKKIFARILKNDYGQGGAWDYYWGALYPKGGKRTHDAQLFVWMDQECLEAGFFIGEYGSAQKDRFLKNAKLYWKELGAILDTRLQSNSLCFGSDDDINEKTYLDFTKWLENVSPDSIRAGISMKAVDVLQSTNAVLITKIADLFDAIFPLVLFATSDDPMAEIASFIDETAKHSKQPIFPIEECATATGFELETLERWCRAIQRKGQAVIFGPPGTGKTFIAEHLARHIVGGGNGFVELVQFHPSYSYEDFIQGIRPVARREGGLDYPLVPGRFLEFCEKAQGRDGCCVLILDEINRANLSRVFGELMYLLEYRDKEIPLAGGKTFGIPSNVRLLGTMNTADRSIALVDHALRRRFAFLELSPNYAVLQKFHGDSVFSVDGLIEILKRVNHQIGDNHYKVGISFFLRIDIKDHIEDIWLMEIEPYLEEYFFDQGSKIDELRWAKVKNKVLGD
jgi:hypothetical protein